MGENAGWDVASIGICYEPRLSRRQRAKYVPLDSRVTKNSTNLVQHLGVIELEGRATIRGLTCAETFCGLRFLRWPHSPPEPRREYPW
jgi:hypothetical protein